MKAIGYIKMVDPEKGFGFITTSAFEGENRRSIDVYFRLNRWQSGAVVPEFAMPVVFTRDRIDDRETAKNIKPLLCKESHIKLALQQAAQKGRIALYDPNIRKPVLKDVMQEIFERMDNGARDIVRDSVLSVISEVRDEERTGFVEAWSKNAFVRSSLMNIFSGSCEGCDQVALAVVRRALGIRLVNNIRRSLFPEQREFMSFLSLDKYDLCELIVELKGGEVEEMRRPDFSKIKRYKYGARGSALQRKEGMIPIQCKWGSLTGYAGDGYYTFEWQFTNRTPSDICEIEVVPGSDLVKITAKEIVSRLYKSNMNMEAGAAEKLSSLHDTLDKQLQEAGDDVFVYELLQNANDYPNGNEYVDAEFRVLRYKEGGGCLNFCHTGAVFSARNVAAICSANDQDKSDNLKAIGYKGIGFKTVFRFNDRAEVRSGEFGFAFDRKTQEIKDGVPWRTTPCWVYPKVRDGYRVDIRLVPHDPEKLGDGPQSYCHQLKELFEDEKPLLFIPHLRCVRLYLDDWDRPVIRTAKSEDWCTSTQYVENVTPTIRQMINDALKDTEHCRIPPKYGNLEKTAVSFACRRQGRRLLLEDNANLYCYLPAKDAQWGFKFLMNTDMIPNGPRNDIEYSLDVNRYFARIAGGKFFEWIDSLIRSGQYEYDSIFALIPDFEECIKNRNEKVVEFIRAFQAGFESKLSDLKIPSEAGDLVSVKEIVCDATGTVEKLGVSFWKRLNQKGFIACESLRRSEDFKAFIKRYKTDLGISEFGFAELFQTCKSLLGPQESSGLQTLMMDPNVNNQFIDFLCKSKKLIEFSSLPIFLDNSGKLGCAASMYKYSDNLKYLEKCLPEFVGMARFLSPKVNYHDCNSVSGQSQILEGVKFKVFGPRTFLFEVVLARGTGPIYEETRKKLSDIEVSKRFWSYITHYRLWDGKQRFEDDYLLLSKLPFVDENGLTVDSFASDAYSVYIREESSDNELVKARWYAPESVRIINQEYFSGEEGDAIKKFFCDGKVFKNSSQLAYRFNVHGCYLPLAVKFKDLIKNRMSSAKDDLGFYDYLNRCFEDKHISHEKMKMRFGGFPVVDADGLLVDRDRKTVFYYDEVLCSWARNGWIDKGTIIILSQKYSLLKALFNLSGVKECTTNNFGELFETHFANKLSLDTIEKVIAFHECMVGKRSQFVTVTQVASLKHTPVLLYGHDSPVLRGEEVVYLPPNDIDIGAEIAAGRLQNGIRILDSRICTSPVMREYWKGLDCKELQEADLLTENINAYLDEQGKYLRQEISQNDFVSKQECFVKSICAIRVDDWKGKYPTLLKLLKTKMLLLAKKSLELKKPSELTLGTVYKPRCEHEKFGLELAYVYEGFANSPVVDQVRDFFIEIGVNNLFVWNDVGFFSSHPEFCKYFWSEYLPTMPNSFLDKWIGPLSSVPSLLTQTGEVRRPDELYSPELSGQIGERLSWKCHLPDFSGFGEKAMQEAIRLSLRSTPYFNDIIDYLLTSDADKALALEWLAQYDTLTQEDISKVDVYRESPNARWENSQGDLCPIKQLVTIAFANSDDAKALSGHKRAMRIQKLGRAEIREKALRHLRVKIVADKDLIPERIKSSEQRDVFRIFLPGLFVYVACREGDGWNEVFEKYRVELAKCSFVRCDKIGLHYEDMRLENRHFCLGEKSHELYYVGEPQGRRVFESMVRAIREWLGIKGDIEELKDVFDPETNLGTMLIEKCRRLLEDEKFTAKLKEVCPAVYDAVQRKSSCTVAPPPPPEGCGMSSGKDLKNVPMIDKPSSKRDEDKAAGGADCGGRDVSFGVDAVSVAVGGERACAARLGVDGEAAAGKDGVAVPVRDGDKGNLHDGSDCAKDEKKEEQKNRFNDTEAEQMRRVFRNDLTVEEMNDINRLDCIRLFNSLKAQGFEPRYLIGGNEQREKEYDGRSPELLESDFINDVFDKKINHSATIETNDGRIIHVIGAINGVAHLPPRWWTRIARQRDYLSVKYVVCAIVYHKEDGFRYLQTRSDLMNAIGDRFTIVRVQSESIEERFEKTLALFAADPECSDYSTYSLLLLHKMRSDTSYECVFTEDFREDSQSEW